MEFLALVPVCDLAQTLLLTVILAVNQQMESLSLLIPPSMTQPLK